MEESGRSYWRSLDNSQAKADANWVLLSEMHLECNLNQENTYLKTSWATPAVSMIVGQWRKITPIVRLWSTTTRIESKPSERGRPVMRSTEMDWKRRRDSTDRGKRPGIVEWVLILVDLQVAQPATNLWTKETGLATSSPSKGGVKCGNYLHGL